MEETKGAGNRSGYDNKKMAEVKTLEKKSKEVFCMLNYVMNSEEFKI